MLRLRSFWRHWWVAVVLVGCGQRGSGPLPASPAPVDATPAASATPLPDSTPVPTPPPSSPTITPAAAQARSLGCASSTIPAAAPAGADGGPAGWTRLELPNAGFESANADNSPAGWTLDSYPARTALAALTDEQAHSGATSVRLQHGGRSVVSLISAPQVTQAYRRHRATAYVYSEGGHSALQLDFWDAAGVRLATSNVDTREHATWERLELTALSPGQTASVSVSVVGPVNVPGVTYADDVELTWDNEVRWWAGDKYLLFDDHYVAALENVSRVVHPATKRPAPVLLPEHPWEFDNVFVSGTALCDAAEGLLKLWYMTIDPEPPHQAYVLYATSHDGLRWDKPNLGLHNYAGSTDNNIVGAMVGPLTVIKDERDADPGRRYKLLAWDRAKGYSVYFSPDGLQWTADQGNPILPDGDVAVAFYDPREQHFVAVSKVNDGRGRTAAISYSTNFTDWTPQRVVMAADQYDQGAARAIGYTRADIYGMPVMPYGDLYVGFPWVFYQQTPPGQPDMGPVDVQLAFSRDLVNWWRTDRSPAIPRGPGGSFDEGMIFTASQPLLVGDELWLYYGGVAGLHASYAPAAIGLATWPLDRLASLSNGGFIEGVITTVPITVTGGQLSVNAAIRGGLQVELLDAEGNVWPGFERENSVAMAGDALEHTVSWLGEASLARLVGQPVSLRFYLKAGDLYSFELR